MVVVLAYPLYWIVSILRRRASSSSKKRASKCTGNRRQSAAHTFLAVLTLSFYFMFYFSLFFRPFTTTVLFYSFSFCFFFLADNTTYNAVLDGEIALPCNITAPSFDDGVSLVLWYRDDIASPIYTVDARSSASLESAQHFLHRDIFEKRASFNLSYPLSFLRIKPVKSSDGGDYRCRVDFRRARTVNRILKLTVIGECMELSIAFFFSLLTFLLLPLM